MMKMPSKLTRAVWIAVLGWTVAMGAVQMARHNSLQTGGRDLGLFDHPLSNTIHGHFLQSSLLPDTARNYFGFHFCPIILVFLPFYALKDGPEVLLIGHVIILGLSALSLFAVARRLTSERWALLMALMYLFYRPLIRVASCSYHQESFFPLFLFMAAHVLISQGARIQFWVWIGLCLLTKEDVSVYFLPLSALMLLSPRYRRTGAILGGVCVLYFLTFNQFILPMVSVGGSTEWPEHYRGYGASHLQIMLYAASHPFQLLQDVFDHQTLGTSGSMLLLLGGLPVLSPVSLGALLPALGCFLSTLDVQRSLGLYYSATVFPYLFLGSIGGLHMLASRIPARRHHLVTAYLILLVGVNAANSQFVKWVQPSRWAFTGRAAEAQSVLDAIPSDASVEMQNCLIPHVRPMQRDIGIFPEKPDAEYVVLFKGADPWPLTEDAFSGRVQELSNDANLMLVATHGPCVMYRRINRDAGVEMDTDSAMQPIGGSHE